LIVFLNGAFVDAAEARIGIDDAGFLFADGVFETALLQGGGFLHLAAHLRRFTASAQLMRLPVPPESELDDIIRQVARRNGLLDANIRITLTRGHREPTLLVSARPPAAAWAERAARGWTLITAGTRRPSTAAVPAQLKALGRTYALLARHEAAEAGADDALLLTDQGYVCEGPAWNVFWRRGERLRTPALELGVLAGVTRNTLIDLAPNAGWTVEQGAWDRAELDGVDEIFATMTSVGIVSIRSLDGVLLPSATPAATTLLPLYQQVVATAAAADPL
jgi:branched-chain amino acid aminotransferase